jgi:hypothetical protein
LRQTIAASNGINHSAKASAVFRDDNKVSAILVDILRKTSESRDYSLGLILQ